MTSFATLCYREHGIAELRLRLNWWGKPVLQARKVLWRIRFVGPDKPAVEECKGMGPWRDVGRDDAIEAGAALAAVSRRATAYAEHAGPKC